MFLKKRPLPILDVLFAFLKCSCTVAFVTFISFQSLFRILKKKILHEYVADNALFLDGQSNGITSVFLAKHCF